MSGSKRSGEMLIERGVIDEATATLIEAEGLLTRSRYLSAAVALGHVSEAQALAVLASQAGVPAIDLTRVVIARGVLERVPLEVARQRAVLPVHEDGAQLMLAMANPADRGVIEEVSFASGMHVLPYAALHARVAETIPQAYAASGPVFRGPMAPATGTVGELPIVVDAQAPPPVDIEIVVDDAIEPIDGNVDAGNEAAPGGTAGAGAPPSGSGRPVVLVVEDEPEVARLVETTVAQLGVEVVTAGRGLQALRLIKERRPALIILDAMLPEIHGFEICRKVKESKRFGATPVLMVSAVYRGWRIAEDIKATYKADAFLEKPFRTADLRRIAQQLLERPRAVVDDGRVGAEAQSLVAHAQQALATGDTGGALESLRRAESVEPFSPRIQLFIAQALEKRDRPFQALYHYERALELAPGLFPAAQGAAVLYQARGFRYKAIEMWERALRASSNAELREQIKQHIMGLL